jgi:hypothetical protein
VAYLCFRLGMTADRVAKYLGIQLKTLESMIHDMRRLATTQGLGTNNEGVQLKTAVDTFMRERAAAKKKKSGACEVCCG